jgi:hypothetical protein
VEKVKGCCKSEEAEESKREDLMSNKPAIDVCYSTLTSSDKRRAKIFVTSPQLFPNQIIILDWGGESIFTFQTFRSF